MLHTEIYKGFNQYKEELTFDTLTRIEKIEIYEYLRDRLIFILDKCKAGRATKHEEGELKLLTRIIKKIQSK